MSIQLKAGNNVIELLGGYLTEYAPDFQLIEILQSSSATQPPESDGTLYNISSPWRTFLKGRSNAIEPNYVYYYKCANPGYYSLKSDIPLGNATVNPINGTTAYIYVQLTDSVNSGTFCELGLVYDETYGWQAYAKAQVSWDNRLPLKTNFGTSNPAGKIIIPRSTHSFAWWYDDSTKDFNMKIDDETVICYNIPIVGRPVLMTATTLCTPDDTNIRDTTAYFANLQWQNCQLGDYYGSYTPFLSDSTATNWALLHNRIRFKKSGNDETVSLNPQN